MSEPQNNPIRDLNNARNLPREVQAVSRGIGKLAAAWKFGDITTSRFAKKAQEQLNKLAVVEEERDRYRKALERLRDTDLNWEVAGAQETARSIARDALGE